MSFKKTFTRGFDRLNRIRKFLLFLISTRPSSKQQSSAKHAEDSGEKSVCPAVRKIETSPFEDFYKDIGIVQEIRNDKEVPKGFEVLNGVVLNATNSGDQEVVSEWTQYKIYDPSTQTGGNVLYQRNKQELDYNFDMFEDPMESSSLSHSALIRKLLGLEPKSDSANTKEQLGNSVVEEDQEKNDDKKPSDEAEIEKEDPNDSAGIEGAMKVPMELNENEKDAITKIDEDATLSNAEDNDATDSPQENEDDEEMQDVPIDSDAQNIATDKQEEMGEGGQ